MMQENNPKTSQEITSGQPAGEQGEQVIQQSPETPGENRQKPLEAVSLRIAAQQVIVIYSDQDAMKNEVTRYLESLGVTPVLSQNKGNAFMPLAEKLNQHRGIVFAIVILNADDLVYHKDGKPQNALLRAGQKTVFELGFWVGRLGRKKVFTLYKEKKLFRHPTEFYDVIYTPFDDNGLWQKELHKRLADSDVAVEDLGRGEKKS